MNKELLSVTKCVTTKSKNKNLRMKYETEGTKFYVIKNGDGYLFSKIPIKNAKETIVRRTDYPTYYYLPVKSIIAEEGYITLYKNDENSYIAMPSTEEEIKKYSMKKKIYKESGYIPNTSANGIHLIKKDLKKLYEKGYLRIHIVNDGRKLYAEVKAISESGKYKTQSEVASEYGGYEFLGEAKDYVYERKIPVGNVVLPLPYSFMRAAKTKVGDKMHTYFRKDDTFVIEACPLVCDICGKEINRYEDISTEITVCKSCKKEIPYIHKKKEKKYDYKEMLQELSNIRKELEKIFQIECKMESKEN